MFHALRASRLTPIWVLLGTLLIVGFAAGAAGRAGDTPKGLVAAFVDINGNGIDDTCETGDIVADPDAVAAEDAAVDLDGDGTISVSEAAQSDRIGGKNCNHGGYVSWVAQGSCAEATPTPTPAQPAFVTGDAPEDATDETTTETTSCDEAAVDPTETPTDAAPTGTPTDQAADTTCVEVPPPDHDPALDEQKNGHGKWVSLVAQSDAIGGKNCNHGGAVSEAAKKDHEAEKAARDAAKAERKAAREAAKGAREHGKGKSQSD